MPGNMIVELFGLQLRIDQWEQIIRWHSDGEIASLGFLSNPFRRGEAGPWGWSHGLGSSRGQKPLGRKGRDL